MKKTTNISVFLIGFFVLLCLLYLAKDIFVPIIFAFLFSVLLDPVVSFFKRFRFSTIWAISLTLFLLIVLSALTMLFLVAQLSRLLDELPKLIQNLTSLMVQTEQWVSTYFDINLTVIQTWVKDANADILMEGRALIGTTIMGVGSVLVVLVLIPVYIFFILYYKSLLLNFVFMLFGKAHELRVHKTLLSMKAVVQNYLVGLIIEASLVAVLNSVALLLLGLEYAVLIGVFGALLNVIPYLGGIVAIALPVIIALATQSSSSAVWVMVLYGFIQFVDNNIIMTKIVASKVQINGLVSVAIVLAGGALWGVSGMFLSIPGAALLKVVCDQSTSFKSFGYVLGVDQSKQY
ncbi:MAG: AI-2E family transporter [Bacteroidetes bacterium B1(2017)]|nr:MAG: AI-2E family transporter [Bacteroidetes bacterium B1(2017)]